jgi:glutamate/tyrosine decarboxylase-like PLP-dependent enzyme
MNELRKYMLSELTDKSIFGRAQEMAFEYANSVFERNVYPTDEALASLEKFDEDLPNQSGNTIGILNRLHEFGSPATVAQIGGRYFGLVNGGVVPAALAVKYVTDFWDQNTPLYVTSPVVSKLESVVEKWLVGLFGLPDETVAGFVSGTSMAILCGLAAARWRIYKRLNYDVNTKGLIGAPSIRIVMGKHAHGTVLKAVALLGLGHDSIEWVDVDGQGRIDPDSIHVLDDRTILILQAGNVNSGSFDDFNSICDIVKETGAWIHIDGAFGLWAAASQTMNHLTKGIGKADSWSVDGHKTLNTPYDNGIVLCKDKEALVSALQASGSYILYGDKRDGMLYTPEMSRRARIVELWATMKYLGREGMDSMITDLHDRAVQFADELSRIDGFTVVNDVDFNQVLVRCATDDITKKTIKRIQDLRECWVGGASWFGRDVIRISVCSWATDEKDVARSVKSFARAHDTVLAERCSI